MEGTNHGAEREPAYWRMAKAIEQHIRETTKHFSYILSAADAKDLHNAHEGGYLWDLFQRDGRFGHICYDRVEKYSRGVMRFDRERRVDGFERPGSRPAAIREFFESGLHEKFLQ